MSTVTDELVTKVSVEVDEQGFREAERALKKAQERFAKAEKLTGEANRKEKFKAKRDLEYAQRDYKKFEDQLGKVQKGVAKSTKALTPFQKALKDTGKIISARLGLKSGGGSIFKNFLTSTTALTGPLGKIITVGTVVAGVFTKIAASVATARREFQKTAESAGTTAQVLDQNRAFIRLLGGKDGDADDLTNSVNKNVQAAWRGDKDAQKNFNKLNLPWQDENKRAIDSGILIFELLKRLNGMMRDADALTASGKLEAGKQKTIEAQKLAEAFGVTPAIFSIIKRLSDEQLKEKFTDSGRYNTTLTDEQEANRTRIAQEWNELSEKFTGIWNALNEVFAEVGLSILSFILPALHAFADAVIWAGKALGLIKETREEESTRLKEEVARDKPRASYLEGFGRSNIHNEISAKEAEIEKLDNEMNGSATKQRRGLGSERTKQLTELFNNAGEKSNYINQMNSRAISSVATPQVKNIQNTVTANNSFKVDVTATGGPEIGQQIVNGAKSIIDSVQLFKSIPGMD